MAETNPDSTSTLLDAVNRVLHTSSRESFTVEQREVVWRINAHVLFPDESLPSPDQGCTVLIFLADDVQGSRELHTLNVIDWRRPDDVAKATSQADTLALLNSPARVCLMRGKFTYGAHRQLTGYDYWYELSGLESSADPTSLFTIMVAGPNNHVTIESQKPEHMDEIYARVLRGAQQRRDYKGTRVVALVTDENHPVIVDGGLLHTDDRCNKKIKLGARETVIEDQAT